MSTPYTGDANLEGLEQENDVQVFDIGMFEGGSEESGFHTKNNPKDPYQRSEVIQRTGHSVDIRCTLIDAVHGFLSEDSDFWASLLVFQFRFDPQKRARRILRATIELRFDVSDAQSSLPEVEAVSFDGNYSFLPSKQSETITKGGEGSLGVNYGAELNASAKWEKTVARETTDATTISGGKLVINNIPPNRIAKWTLLENKTLKTGVPASIRVAVRIKRRDDSAFTCIPRLECKADKWTSLETFFGGVPEDDPVYFKPDLKPTNKLMTYDTEDLGNVDLHKLSDVTFTTMILDAQK
ncbi:intracellular serine protease [Colletotrichum incanum]|uniref:Intracellular serine protease n=1 Tax=Colletotrichum incanum TaxID=1573173 RepID=A0A167DPM1_COLIC|nr:intracellular serine protease [Colletotrichum incanum]